MRIFLAGCNGLLGQNLLRTSEGMGHEIFGSGRSPAPALAGRLSGYHVLDAADPASWDFVRREIRPDRIINAAAFTDVDGCERDPAQCDRVNRDAVRWMAETGIPVVMDPAGADSVTQWDRTPTVVRTATSSSQIGHPFGDYLYKELGARNVTFIGQDYTFGHEVTLGAVQTFKAAGGKVAKIVWNPIGTKDYGPTVASIDPSSDAVVAVVVGADRVRLFEAWFNFGMDKKFKIYGGYWMHQDVLPQLDERAIGMIGNSLNYAAGLDTPENNAFTAAFAKKYKRLPSWFAESGYTASLWTKTAIDKISGKVEDRDAFLKAMRTVEIKAPRGPLKLDAYDNPIQNVYVSRIQKIKHPVLGEVMTNVPIKTYTAVSQFWTWSPEEYLKRGPYKR